MTNLKLNKPAKVLVTFLLLIIVFSQHFLVSADTTKKYIPGGIPFGAKIYCEGLYVSGFADKNEFKAHSNPSIKGGMKAGDIIRKIGEVKILSTDTLYQCIENSNGNQLTITVLRNGKEQNLTVTPYKCSDGKFRLGINVRDSIAGIGTVTYICTDDMSFGGLGHGICDFNTGTVIPMIRGEAYDVKINGINKGNPEIPGEIRGSFISLNNGKITQNTDRGIFGYFDYSKVKDLTAVDVAAVDEVKCGSAELICTLDNEGPKYYAIDIEQIDLNSNNKTKNFIIKIVDQSLINKTVGIIQGMSGSPILQNGKLVGAVTHVLVNDPTRGYGIFIENMLETANTVAEEQQTQKDAS